MPTPDRASHSACVRAGTLGVALVAMFLAHPGLGQTVTRLAPGDDLAVALSAAAPGDVLELAGGAYGSLAVKRAGGTDGKPVTLRSADPADPARLSEMDLREMNHLVLDGLVFDYEYAPEDKPNLRPFQVFTTRNLTIRNSLFDGDLAESDSPDDPAYPTAFGLAVRSSSGITIEDTEIREFYRGLVISDSVDLTVRRNDVHAIRMDGMNFAQVERVVIEENHIHDFRRAVDSADHADMIQFWTNQTERPSVDILIRGNVLNSGKGWYTQSIFMRNEEVDNGRAGEAMFYRGVTIEDNVIINAHLHGISVGETDGLVIRNNSVLRNARSEGKKANAALWTPTIRVSPAARNVQITRNVVAKIEGEDGQAGWTVADNLLVQDTAPTQPGYYDTVFVAARSGDPSNLASFRSLPGGPLAGSGIGASALDVGQSGAIPGAGVANAPAVHLTPDPEFDNRFTFDARLSSKAEGIDPETTQFRWDFGDGKQAEGPVVRHAFAKTGLYKVVLTATARDGSTSESRIDVHIKGPDVLVFDSATGTFTSFAGPEPVTLDLPIGKGPAVLGQGKAVIEIPREQIAPFFGAKDFDLRMRLRTDGGYKAAGELLRIHGSLVVTVTGRGTLDIHFDTSTADQLRLKTRPLRLFSGDWVDLHLRYTADSGLFQVEADGALIAESRTTGKTKPLEHWGLALGNPFNNRETFSGELDMLILQVGRYDFAAAD